MAEIRGASNTALWTMAASEKMSGSASGVASEAHHQRTVDEFEKDRRKVNAAVKVNMP